jgi:uncharacterized protein (TIGR02246 family)
VGNEELVRRLMDAWNSWDPDRVAALYTTDAEIYLPRNIVEGGGYYGREGVRRAVTDIVEDYWESITAEVLEVYGEGDRAVARVRMTNVGSDAGPEVIWDLWLVLRFRDGLVAYGRSLLDRDEAFRDAGLAV